MKFYKYNVKDKGTSLSSEILVIADNEEEARDKLINKNKEYGIECDFYLDDEEYYDFVIS